MKRREFLRAITGSLALPLVPVAFVDTGGYILDPTTFADEFVRAVLAEEQRILYGTPGECRPTGLLDCRSPLKIALDESHAQAGPGSLDRRVS